MGNGKDCCASRRVSGSSLRVDSSSMKLEDDPLVWATAHLPTMTDAEANRAVGRLVAAGTPPFLLLPLLPKIGNVLRTGATKAVDDPSERVAMMSYRDEPDPLLAFAADLARLVPDHHEWALAWVDADLGLQAMQSLVASEPSPSEIGETLRSGRADRFAVVVPWYATEQVDVLLGCPTGRTDVAAN